MKHLKYAKALLRHKWFVFLECCKAGIPWRGFMHDMSKFRPDEWMPYAQFFYGPKAVQRRDKTGYYKPTDTGDKAFDFAWLLHQKRNRHHWQFWILPEDNGGIKILDMPPVYRLEMLCDWKGAGRAYGNPDTLAWYTANRLKMQLSCDTRWWIEAQLGYVRKEIVFRAPHGRYPIIPKRRKSA